LSLKQITQSNKISWETNLILGYLGKKKTKEIKHIRQTLREDFNIYFVNYKNSMLGVGGVGTVTRALLKILPDLNMVCYDPSYQHFDDGANIRNVHTVELDPTDAELFHGVYAKLYLWPVLHNTLSALEKSEVEDVRIAFLNGSKNFAEKTIEVSNLDKTPIYWINDYNLACVAGFIREKAPESKIIFSLRTPFGVSSLPEFFNTDARMLIEGMLNADILTFHREKDVLHFLDFVDKYFHEDSRVNINWHNYTITFNDRLIIPRVFVMGNEPDYRTSLAKSNESSIVKEKFKQMTKGVVITSVSRFDKTKGIEFELDCIEALLRYYPQVKEKFTFLRVSYLSDRKKNTTAYTEIYNAILKRIEEINAKYGTDSWQPIVGKFDNKLNDLQITGLLRATDVLFIGSLGDGFNHIAVESAMSKTNGDSPMQIVTTNIGATDYLDGYSLIDHQDVTASAGIIYNAMSRDLKIVKLKYKTLKKDASRLYAYNWALSILQASIDIRKVPIITNLNK
jgi:trehalose-6-phosphate synthase